MSAQNQAQTGSSSTAIDDDPKSKLLRTEAVLILSRGSLTTRKLATLAGLADATEARTLIRQLNQLYDENERSFRVEEVAGGYEMLTRPQFAPYLRRLGHVPQAIRLSSPAMETLAIVAYRQPVMRADIEAVRGVQSGELLKQLMERDLVRISGRSEELGRPYLYSTTKRFLQVFGLRNTDALPCADWFEPDPEENYGSDPKSSQKESDVSIAIASDVEQTEETQVAFDGAPALAVASASPAPKAADDEDWDEEGDDWDDDEDDGDDEDGDWEEGDEEEGDWEDDDDEEFDDEESDGEDEYDDDDEDGDWKEVDDEESDEEWDDDEEDGDDLDEGEDNEEDDGEWVEEDDDDDWDDDDEGEY